MLVITRNSKQWPEVGYHFGPKPGSHRSTSSLLSTNHFWPVLLGVILNTAVCLEAQMQHDQLQCRDSGSCLTPEKSVGEAASGTSKCRVSSDSLSESLECSSVDAHGMEFWKRVRWFADWAYDSEKVELIRQYLRSGQFVEISYALTTQASEALHSELWRASRWKHQLKDGNIHYSRHVVSCTDEGSFEGVFAGHCLPVVEAFHRFLKRDLNFWSQFSDLAVDDWEPAYPATWYRKGDFAAPHNDTDAGTAGELAFNLHLTKDWDVSYGGAFWFFKSKPIEYQPSFNSLYLFQTAHDSTHLVSPVIYGEDDKRRFAISGWFKGPEQATRQPIDA